MLPVFDPWEDRWVGRVRYNHNLKCSRDLYGVSYGCTRLRKTGKYVLIRDNFLGTSAEVIAPEDLINKALELEDEGALDYILKRWPELQELAARVVDEEEEERTN